jgi:hypothetical protein
MPYWYENPIPWFNNQCADRFTEAALPICHVERTGGRLWCTRDQDLSFPSSHMSFDDQAADRESPMPNRVASQQEIPADCSLVRA